MNLLWNFNIPDKAIYFIPRTQTLISLQYLLSSFLHDIGILWYFEVQLTVPPTEGSTVVRYGYYVMFILFVFVSYTFWLYQWHGGCLLRSRHCLSFSNTWVHPAFFDGVRVAQFCLFYVVDCFVFLFVFVLCLAYPMLPVFLDCPFFIAHSLTI